MGDKTKKQEKPEPIKEEHVIEIDLQDESHLLEKTRPDVSTENKN